MLALPSTAYDAGNLFLIVDDCIAVLPSATFAPEEMTRNSYMLIGLPVLEYSLSTLALG